MRGWAALADGLLTPPHRTDAHPATHPPARLPCLPALCRVIAETGVQFISCGALTHSVMALDISLNIETQ